MGIAMTMITRREMLAVSLASTTAPLLAAPAIKADEEVAFFLVGDTHYLAEKEATEKLAPLSAGTNARLIDHLNRLPGTAIPDAAGGGKVAAVRGVVHAGDVIDSGDKSGGQHTAMQKSEWSGFVADYGLTGQDGRLKVPVYEVHGNHDSPSGTGLAIDMIRQRNRSRPGLTGVSKNGVHYSWDWGPVHFVNLGIVVGSVPEVTRKRRYNPLDSLEFLVSDLADHVGASGRPVVLTHHIDLARYSTPPDPAGPPTSKEWDPCDVRGYYEALAKYNIAAILYGHTHARNLYRWNGTPERGTTGIPVFNVDNSAHFANQAQAIFYFHLHGRNMIVRELATPDRWETAAWTPQAWKFELAATKR